MVEPKLKAKLVLLRSRLLMFLWGLNYNALIKAYSYNTIRGHYNIELTSPPPPPKKKKTPTNVKNIRLNLIWGGVGDTCAPPPYANAHSLLSLGFILFSLFAKGVIPTYLK